VYVISESHFTVLLIINKQFFRTAESLARSQLMSALDKEQFALRSFMGVYASGKYMPYSVQEYTRSDHLHVVGRSVRSWITSPPPAAAAALNVHEVRYITGSAVALHCCKKAHSKINRKHGKFDPPVKSQPLEISF